MTRGLALVTVDLMRVVGISAVLQLTSAFSSDLCSHGIHSGSQLATFPAGLAAEKAKISEKMTVGDIQGQVIGRSWESAYRLPQMV
jgi:hypothetical protein